MSLPRAVYNPNEPQQSMSLANLRNTLRGLFQGDLMPLRARASMILDGMEYATDALAQANWAGTGVTVTTTTTKHEGSYALQCLIDATGNRKVSKSQALNLSTFLELKLWERVDVASSEIQFYLKDGSANESYWDIITSGTPDDWQQDTLDLTTPDSNSGSPADLGDIVEWGFLGLDADKTYIFDDVKVICGLNVAVEGGLLAEFYQQVYLGATRISFAGGSSPIITPPAANPRIDLLVLNSSNILEWVVGTEASSPSEPNSPTTKIPICLIYCKVGMVQVVDYEDKDGNPTEGYILKDVRPLMTLGAYPEILSGLDASKPAIYIKDRFYWATDTYKLYWDTGSAWTDITALFAGFVRLTGDQTVAGIKTFSSIPVLPASDPTTDNQATRWKSAKDYADSVAGKVGTKIVDETAIGDLKYPQYKTASGKLEYVTVDTTPADGSISQAKLKTATGEVSTTAGGNLTLPGGEYGFYPQVKQSNAVTLVAQISGADPGATYVTVIHFEDTTGTSYAQQRYVTASGSDHWLFLLVDKVTKEIISAWSAPDHPSYGNGGNFNKIPHPFLNYDKTKYEIVLVDNDTVAELKTQVTEEKSLLTLVNENYKTNMVKEEIYQPLHSGKYLIEDKDGKQVQVRQMIKNIPDFIKVRKLIKLTQVEKNEKEIKQEQLKIKAEQDRQIEEMIEQKKREIAIAELKKEGKIK